MFAKISVNDVWSAQYHTYDKAVEWSKELAETIQGQTVDEASKYIKTNFNLFGKVSRTIIGHKIGTDSNNTYYSVRNLEIHFNLLQKESKTVHEAQCQSIRNLDVNTLQYLIFNGIKYVLKSK